MEGCKAISPAVAGGTERKLSLKWLERRLAKWSIMDCRSWVWRVAFGLSERWALHNPIFLLNTGTKSLERQRWKWCVCVCKIVLKLGPGEAPGKFRNYCGWTAYKVQCVSQRDLQNRNNGHESQSGPLETQGPDRSSPAIHPQALAHMKTPTHIWTYQYFLPLL